MSLLSILSTALLILSQDRRPLTMQALMAPPPPTDLTQAPAKLDTDQNDLCTGSSAKIDQLVHLLKLIPNDSKSLVFSQFTTFLDKVIVTYDYGRIFALTCWIDWRGTRGTWASPPVEHLVISLNMSAAFHMCDLMESYPQEKDRKCWSGSPFPLTMMSPLLRGNPFQLLAWVEVEHKAR